jgi:hypothetical protein
MPKGSLDRLVSDLSKLSTEDLAKLDQHVKVMRAVTGPSTVTVPAVASGKRDLESRALGVLCAAMRDMGVEYPSVEMLRKTSQIGAFNRKLPAVMQFISGIGPKRVEQDALLKIAFELLYYDLVTVYELAASSLTLMAQVHRIPAVINRHFPGYAESNLLGMILKEKK